MCIVAHHLSISPSHIVYSANGLSDRPVPLSRSTVINTQRWKCDERGGEGHRVNEYIVQIRRSGHSMYRAIGKNRRMHPSYPSNFHGCTVTQESATAFQATDCRGSLELKPEYLPNPLCRIFELRFQ